MGIRGSFFWESLYKDPRKTRKLRINREISIYKYIKTVFNLIYNLSEELASIKA
jgi:hypothetical protein